MHPPYVLSERFYRYCLSLRLSFQMEKASEWFDLLDLEGACGDAAYLIQKHLTKMKVDSRLMTGIFKDQSLRVEHCWTEVDVSDKRTYIVDITATQFDRNLPPVVIKRKNDLSKYQRGEHTPKPGSGFLRTVKKDYERIYRRARGLFDSLSYSEGMWEDR